MMLDDNNNNVATKVQRINPSLIYNLHDELSMENKLLKLRDLQLPFGENIYQLWELLRIPGILPDTLYFKLLQGLPSLKYPAELIDFAILKLVNPINKNHPKKTIRQDVRQNHKKEFLKDEAKKKIVELNDPFFDQLRKVAFKRKDSCFVPLKKCIDFLQSFNNNLNQLSNDLIKAEFKAKLLKILISIKDFYLQWINDVCRNYEDDRKVLFRIPGSIHLLNQLHYPIAHKTIQAILPLSEDNELHMTSGASHPVFSFEGLHFKILTESRDEYYPEKNSADDPGMAFAIKSLFQLMVPGQMTVPPTELVSICPSRLSWRNILPFPAQVSLTVGDGELNQEYMETHPDWDQTINPENASAQIILGLISRQGDAKPENYRYEISDNGKNNSKLEIRLLNIDSEQAFVNTFYQNKYLAKNCMEHMIVLRNILYCSDYLMNQPINAQYCQYFLHLKPEMIIMEWLYSLYQRNNYYQHLLQEKLFSEDVLRSMHLPFRLQGKTVQQLYADICRLRGYLINHPSAMHRDIFYFMLPEVAYCYENLRNKFSVHHDKIHSFFYEHLYRTSMEEKLGWDHIISSSEDSLKQWNGQPITALLAQFQAEKHDYLKRQLTPQEAATQWLQALDFGQLTDEAQNETIKILILFPFISDLTLRNCQYLKDQHLKFLAKNAKQRGFNLERLSIIKCSLLTSAGLLYIINEYPKICITIDNCQLISDKELANLVKSSAQIIIRTGQNENFALDPNQPNLLHKAVMSEDLTILRFVLEYLPHIPLNSRDLQGNTPLHLAAKSNNFESVKALLEKKIIVNCPNFEGLFPIDVARKVDTQIILMNYCSGEVDSAYPKTVLENLQNLGDRVISQNLLTFSRHHQLLNFDTMQDYISSETTHLDLSIPIGTVSYHRMTDLFLQQLLQHCSKLEYVNFSGCSGVRQNTLHILAQSGVKKVDLRYSQVQGLDLTQISPLQVNVIILDIDQLIPDIEQKLPSFPLLKEVYLANKKISGKKAAYLIQTLQKNTHIQILELNNNSLGPEAIGCLSTWLSRNSSLRILNLQRIGMTPEEVKILALGLAKNSSLEQLDLCQNNIGASGKTLISIFQANPDCKLKSFNLNNCNIDNEVMTTLASWLSQYSRLQDLDIGWNNSITDKGTQDLIAALKINKSLKLNLRYGGIRMSEETQNALMAVQNRMVHFVKQQPIIKNELPLSKEVEIFSSSEPRQFLYGILKNCLLLPLFYHQACKKDPDYSINYKNLFERYEPLYRVFTSSKTDDLPKNRTSNEQLQTDYNWLLERLNECLLAETSTEWLRYQSHIEQMKTQLAVLEGKKIHETKTHKSVNINLNTVSEKKYLHRLFGKTKNINNLKQLTKNDIQEIKTEYENIIHNKQIELEKMKAPYKARNLFCKAIIERIDNAERLDLLFWLFKTDIEKLLKLNENQQHYEFFKPSRHKSVTFLHNKLESRYRTNSINW